MYHLYFIILPRAISPYMDRPHFVHHCIFHEHSDCFHLAALRIKLLWPSMQRSYVEFGGFVCLLRWGLATQPTVVSNLWFSCLNFRVARLQCVPPCLALHPSIHMNICLQCSDTSSSDVSFKNAFSDSGGCLHFLSHLLRHMKILIKFYFSWLLMLLYYIFKKKNIA